MFTNIDLSTWVQIFSTVSFTILTLWIILQNRKTIGLVLKDRERPTIKEIVQIIIAPSISKLEAEIDDLHRKEYGWSHQRKRMDNISAFTQFMERRNAVLLDDLLRKYPELEISRHDNLVSTLNEKLAKLDDKINTQEFSDKCCKLIKEYNDRINELKTRYSNPPILQESKYYDILGHVVEGNSHIYPAYGCYAFWEECGGFLLKEREGNITKEIVDEIEKMTNDLIKCSEPLQDKLIEIRENYRKKYNFSVKETEAQW